MKRSTVPFSLFVGCVVASNILTANVPPVLGVTAGTLTAGLVLLVRDWLDETGGRLGIVAAILAGAVLSAGMTPGVRLALASFAAFALSELVDWLVYRPLRRRGWAKAAIASNVAGAIVDSFLFLAVAGFPLWPGVPAQALVKALVSALFVGVVVVGNAVLRNRVRPQGA